MNDYQSRADCVYNALVARESGADQEQLFLCSYLLGHISLVGAEEGDSTAQFEQRVQKSLSEAFKVDKLTDQDKAAIASLWDALRTAS